jgi:hypothetical protein
MRFDRQKLEPFFRYGVITPFQVRLSPKRLGKDWQKVLEEVVRRVG